MRKEYDLCPLYFLIGVCISAIAYFEIGTKTISSIVLFSIGSILVIYSIIEFFDEFGIRS